MRRSVPPGWIFRGLLAGGVLAIGGAPSWAVAALAVGWAACLGVAHASVPLQAVKSPLFWGLALAVAWTAVQALPLGFEAGGGFEGVTALGTLSVDPGETVLALVRALTALCAYLVTSACVAHWGRTRVLVHVAAAAVITAAVGLVHAAAGLDRVFGLYEPLHAHPPFGAPLVNPNHLAGVLGGCLPLVVARTLGGHRDGWQLGWIAGLIGVLVMLGLTGSNAGYVGALSGCLVMVGARWRPVRGLLGGWGRSSMALVVAASAAFFGTVVWRVVTGRERPVVEALLAKFQVYRELPGLGEGLLWSGAGRGGFAVVHFGAVAGVSRRHFAESWPAQLWVDFGAPVSLALVGLMLWGLYRSRHGWRSPVGAAVLGAVVAFGVHDLADFSLELLGIRVMFTALLAVVALTGGSSRAGQPVAGRVGSLVLAALALLGGGVAWLYGPHLSMLELQAKLRTMPAVEAAGLARRQQPWHPREPVLAAFIGAGELSAGRPREAWRWLVAVQRRAPAWSEGHRLVGIWLDSQGLGKQAAIEIRESERLDPKSADATACRWMREGRVELVVRAAPQGEVGTRFLARAARCVEGGRRELDEALLERDPAAALPRERVARRLSAERDWEGVLSQVQAVPSAHRNAGLVELDFGAHMALGEVEEATRTLARAADWLPEEPLWRARFQLALQKDDLDAARTSLVHLRTVQSDRSRAGQGTLMWAAKLWARHGHPEESLEVYRAAYQALPSVETLDRMIESAQASGRHTQADVLSAKKCLEFRVGCSGRRSP